MNELNIKQRASQLLTESGVSGTYPVPVEKIASFLGFECHYFNPNEKTNNISGAVNHSKKKIYINPEESPKRQLFTVAHEIGHIYLHGIGTDHIDYRFSQPNPDHKEVEANHFAADLLMPEDLFIYLWKEKNKDIYKLSDFFGVSPTAIAVRAEFLNLD